MDALTIFILLVIGLTAGVAGGVFGIGGGTIIVPAMIYLLPMTLQEAQAASLTALLLPVGVFGAYKYYKSGYIHLRSSLLISIGLLCGTPVGALINESLSGPALKIVYAIFLFYIAYRFIEPVKLIKKYFLKNRNTEGYKDSENIEKTETVKRRDQWFIILPVGFLAGISSGLFGIGGGAIIVPALTFICHFDYKTTIGISLGALLPPVSIGGVLVHFKYEAIDISHAAPVAAGIMVGAFIGAYAGVAVKSGIIKKLYGLFLIGTAFYVIFSNF